MGLFVIAILAHKGYINRVKSGPQSHPDGDNDDDDNDGDG